MSFRCAPRLPQLVPRRSVHMYLPQPPIHGATHVIQLNVKGRYILFELPEAVDRQPWYACAAGRQCRWLEVPA